MKPIVRILLIGLFLAALGGGLWAWRDSQADVALAEQNLKDALLYAPSEGVIQERLLEVGDMAAPERPVFTLALIDPVWVRAYAAEVDLGKNARGDEGHGGDRQLFRPPLRWLDRVELRRSEMKVPSPPTREGRGEGNLRGKFRFWLSQVVARSHSCSTSSRRENHLPWGLDGVAMRGGPG